MKEKYTVPTINSEELYKKDILLGSADHDNHTTSGGELIDIEFGL